jgi:hypothetical protein
VFSWRLRNVTGYEPWEIFILPNNPDTSDDGTSTFPRHFKVKLVFLPVNIAVTWDSVFSFESLAQSNP